MWNEFWCQLAICLSLIVLVIGLLYAWNRRGCSGDCSRACNCGEE